MHSSIVRPPTNPRAHRLTTYPLQESPVMNYISSNSRLSGIPSNWNVFVSRYQQSTSIQNCLGSALKLPRLQNSYKPQSLKDSWAIKSPCITLSTSSCSRSRHSITILNKKFRVLSAFSYKIVKHDLICNCSAKHCAHTQESKDFLHMSSPIHKKSVDFSHGPKSPFLERHKNKK